MTAILVNELEIRYICRRKEAEVYVGNVYCGVIREVHSFELFDKQVVCYDSDGKQVAILWGRLIYCWH